MHSQVLYWIQLFIKKFKGIDLAVKEGQELAQSWRKQDAIRNKSGAIFREVRK